MNKITKLIAKNLKISNNSFQKVQLRFFIDKKDNLNSLNNNQKSNFENIKKNDSKMENKKDDYMDANKRAFDLKADSKDMNDSWKNDAFAKKDAKLINDLDGDISRDSYKKDAFDNKGYNSNNIRDHEINKKDNINKEYNSSFSRKDAKDEANYDARNKMKGESNESFTLNNKDSFNRKMDADKPIMEGKSAGIWESAKNMAKDAKEALFNKRDEGNNHQKDNENSNRKI